MRHSPRAALSAASFACALVAAAVSAPSFALDAGGAQSATAMLAAVTGPLLAVDPQTLARQATGPDFSTGAGETTQDEAGETGGAQSLADLVEANGGSDGGTDDDRCLATAVYFESKGEPLNGQLAVAQTILNRTHSDHFPGSVCGVVRQPGQFSFLRDGDLPDAPATRTAWHTAVAIAKIAREGLWKEVAPASLYFHARRVSPGWGKVRVASIGNHVFFR